MCYLQCQSFDFIETCFMACNIAILVNITFVLENNVYSTGSYYNDSFIHKT